MDFLEHGEYITEFKPKQTYEFLFHKRYGNHVLDIIPVLSAFSEAAGYARIAYIQTQALPEQNVNLGQPW